VDNLFSGLDKTVFSAFVTKSILVKITLAVFANCQLYSTAFAQVSCSVNCQFAIKELEKGSDLQSLNRNEIKAIRFLLNYNKNWQSASAEISELYDNLDIKISDGYNRTTLGEIISLRAQQNLQRDLWVDFQSGIKKVEALANSARYSAEIQRLYNVHDLQGSLSEWNAELQNRRDLDLTSLLSSFQSNFADFKSAVQTVGSIAEVTALPLKNLKKADDLRQIGKYSKLSTSALTFYISLANDPDLSTLEIAVKQMILELEQGTTIRVGPGDNLVFLAAKFKDIANSILETKRIQGVLNSETNPHLVFLLEQAVLAKEAEVKRLGYGAVQELAGLVEYARQHRNGPNSSWPN